MTTNDSLIIIYNADATVIGKLRYAYRKLSRPIAAGPACAACDITHGGLSLRESTDWSRVKADIEACGMTVVQWHRDELSAIVKNWIKSNEVQYPVVLLRTGEDAALKVVASSEDLAMYQGQPTKLLEDLREKGILLSKARI